VQMTTVSQDATALASAAVDQALQQAGGAAPIETVRTPRLVVRATTAPPPPPRGKPAIPAR
jgi:DNA-binding LacI/PurR family transcriptional regulator